MSSSISTPHQRQSAPAARQTLPLQTRGRSEADAGQRPRVDSAHHAAARLNAPVQWISPAGQFDLLLEQARKVAQYDLTTLITGESGTGKTTLARYIHEQGPRHERPLVVVNCATLPRDLLESELFGHAKGAFTGAVADRPGRVEGCEGGTLVLDEVGDLPLELQPKLLMFLQDRVYYRVGCDRPRRVDVRVIAATNRPLLELCRRQEFREDLYYRLSVLRLAMPALRQRPEAILPLAGAILERISAETGAPCKSLTDAAQRKLRLAAWHGNVRELENVLQRAAVFSPSDSIDADDLVLDERTSEEAGPQLAGRALADIERQAIQETLEACDGNRAAAAAQLGISERSVYNKLKRYRLD